MNHTVALQLLVALTVATAMVSLCQRLGLSPILGYLTAGVLVGPFGLGWLQDGAEMRLLAEFGVVLLMFTVGLELSLPRLMAARRLVLGLGSAQVGVSMLLFGAIALAMGLPLSTALVIASALAMSSTAIVLKQLAEQRELPAPHGRVVTGVLLLQDIAAILVLVALPVMAAEPSALGVALGAALLKAGLVFAGLVLLGRWALPPALHWVASTRSLELFMLSALLMAAAAAGVAMLAGLSPTLGAFMAGTLLGETQFRHQIESDIRPFRDLMLGVFFATVGMQLDPRVLLAAPLAVLLVAALLVVVKPLIIAPLVRAGGHAGGDAWRAALCLGQGGEFGLLIVASALGLGFIEDTVAQWLLAGLVASMLIAPLILRFNQTLAARLSRQADARRVPQPEAGIAEASRDYDQHVIICGFGRLGQNVLRVLTDEGIAAIALDMDPERVRRAAAAGDPVLFGNATQPGVLRAAGLDRARALALTMEDAAVAERIVCHVRALGVELPILVRSAHGRSEQALLEAGAAVFPEGLESSLAFAGQLLVMIDVPPSQVDARINEIRAVDYAPLRAFFHSTEPDKARAEALDYPRQMRPVLLDEGHYATGRTVQELQFDALGVKLVDVRRGAIRMPGQALDARFRAGDVLLLEGRAEAIEQAVSRLVEGG